MREWIVSVPIVGRMDLFVTAKTEADAERKAFAGEIDGEEIVESSIVRECRGNVCNLSSGVEVFPND